MEFTKSSLGSHHINPTGRRWDGGADIYIVPKSLPTKCLLAAKDKKLCSREAPGQYHQDRWTPGAMPQARHHFCDVPARGAQPGSDRQQVLDKSMLCYGQF